MDDLWAKLQSLSDAFHEARAEGCVEKSFYAQDRFEDELIRRVGSSSGNMIRFAEKAERAGRIRLAHDIYDVAYVEGLSSADWVMGQILRLEPASTEDFIRSRRAQIPKDVEDNGSWPYLLSSLVSVLNSLRSAPPILETAHARAVSGLLEVAEKTGGSSVLPLIAALAGKNEKRLDSQYRAAWTRYAPRYLTDEEGRGSLDDRLETMASCLQCCAYAKGEEGAYTPSMQDLLVGTWEKLFDKTTSDPCLQALFFTNTMGIVRDDSPIASACERRRSSFEKKHGKIEELAEKYAIFYIEAALQEKGVTLVKPGDEFEGLFSSVKPPSGPTLH